MLLEPFGSTGIHEGLPAGNPTEFVVLLAGADVQTRLLGWVDADADSPEVERIDALVSSYDDSDLEPSSRHARILREGHVLMIEDLGSTNGTYLNEEPLSGPQPLYDGDRIRIGDSEFSYLQ